MSKAEKPGIHARYKVLALPIKIAIWVGLFFLAVSVLGFLVAPPVAKKVLENKLPTLLHRPVSIGKISFNPFSLAVAVENFHIGQKDGPGDLVAFDRLFINLEAASLFKRALIIKAVSLSRPRLEFSRIGDQTYNFSDLLAEDPAKKAAPPEKSEPLKFAIRNIEIKGGRVIFHDLPKKTDHSVTDLNLGVPALSNLSYQVETYIQPSFSATINGTSFAVGGQSKPFAKSLETVVELKATGINIPEYLAYIPNPTGLVLQSARLDVDANLRLLARPDNTYRLAVIGRVGLRDLTITDRAGQPYLQFPELAVTLADSDLLAKEVHLTEINLTSPVVNLERLADGRLQPVALLTQADSQSQGGAAATAADSSGKSDQEAGPALKLDIDKVRLTDGQVNFLEEAAGARVSTRLDIDTSLHLQGQPDNSTRLAVVGRVVLRDLAMVDKGGKAYLKLPELALTLADANLLANEVHLSEINLQSPTVSLERLADGRILPVAFFARPDQPKSGDLAKPAASAETGKAAGEPLKLAIDKVVLGKGRVDFLDSAVAGVDKVSRPPARLSLRDLTVQVDSLSNAPEALASLILSSNLNEAGKLKVRGQLGLEPFQTKLNLLLSDLALKPFQPYVSQQALVVVAGGRLTVAGDLALTPKAAGGGLKTNFQGQADLAQLALLDTVLGEDLLKWRNLGLRKVRFSSEPGRLAISEINLAGLYAKALITKDGVVNLSTLSAAPPKVETETVPALAPAETVPPAQPFATEIGTLVISDGRLDFEDRQVSPAYGNSLGELNGSITNLSSMTESYAQVEVSGKLDRQAPVKVTGRINPLRSDLLVDLKVDFADINLSPMSPYSGKYIGYKLDKGKLNLDLKYHIADRKLDSQNKAFIDQLTLGDEVESPEAANLPVNLALALLRDRQGGINLDVPVYGSLDDPDFSVGRIILKVLLNLIAKAATSPMALLGALIPDGQDIQFIPFAPGQAEIGPEGAAKLAMVENVLYQRPALKMELIGKVEPTVDSEALARLQLRKMVKLRKAQAVGKEVAKEGAAAELELSPEEYPVFLAQAYQSARPAAATLKPGTVAPPPSVAEMENFLLAAIKVGDDQLRLLALARANQVLSSLMAGNKVEPGRLFVIEPRTGKDGGTAQVELVIK